MTNCPKCNATLPDGSQACQFCGNQWGPAPGTARSVGKKSHSGGTPGWIWPAYYGIAGWWILNGVYSVLAATVFAPKEGGGIGSMIGLIIGAFTALVGLGLILRVEAARGIVNVICFIQILSGILDVIMFFFIAPALGVFGVIGFLFAFLRLGLAGLMIFVIGETESRAPNF
jgi:hypothetical protein